MDADSSHYGRRAYVKPLLYTELDIDIDMAQPSFFLVQVFPNASISAYNS